MSACLPSHATAPYQEYRKHIEGAQTLTALNDGLMGDSVSLYNGVTEFSVTDIDLPGNNALPVRLTRRFSIDLNPTTIGSSGGVTDAALGGIGNWTVDVPYISGSYISGGGWPDARCTSGAIPSSPGLNPTDFWHGNTVHVPGGGDRLMLMLESQTPRPSGGAPSNWTTRERDMFTCISMQSGLSGEGFQMQTASGLRYDFNVAVSRHLGYMARPVPGTSLTYSVSRVKYFLLASKITDRFGNTVSFVYNADGHPTSITSSDDGGTARKITLVYSGDQLVSATANGRTWQYTYGSGANADMLATVVQPGSTGKWQYAYTGTLSPVQENWDGNIGPNCNVRPPIVGAAFSMTVTHPSGAIGAFQFSSKRHYRSGVSGGECQHQQVQQNGTWFIYSNLHTPNYFDVMSLTSKTITGPGVAEPMTWIYDYGVSAQGLVGAAGGPAIYPCTTCPTEKIVTVSRPDETLQTYRYGFLYAVNEGRLLGSSVLEADGTVLQTESTTYLSEADAANQNFHPRYGIIIGSDGPSSATVRPVISQTVQQDGATFSMQVDADCDGTYCFDTYGNPTKVTKSSSLSSAYTRTEQTAYFNQTAKWILGQTASVTCTAPISCAGLVMSQTTYDTNTAMPLKTYAFGKLKQTLVYNSNGTVSTVKDGGNHATTLSNWKRGTPQTVTYPLTPDDGSTPANQSAVVDDNGWIRSITDENGFTTSYTYDDIGRITKVTYPTGDTPASLPTTLTYDQVPAAEYGIPANHWKQTVSTGDSRKITYFDAFWKPLVEESYDDADPTNTRSIIVTRYDIRGRQALRGYPRRTLSNYAGTIPGISTTYDALNRVRTTTQSSEIGPLVTTTDYLTGFKVRVTDPRNNQTTTQFQAFDQPSTDAPVSIALPENVITEISRDVFGKPTAIKRHNVANTSTLTRSYVYNAAQELCKTIEPETSSTIMHYDAAGNLDWSASGQNFPSTTLCNDDSVPVAARVVRSYDARNRVKMLVFPDNIGNTTYSYASDGLVASLLVDNGGSDLVTTDYTYTRRRLLKSERLRFGVNDWSLGYTYDPNGHLDTLTYPDGLQVDYQPNALGQPTKASGYALGITYYPNGAIYSFTYGNGIVHTMLQNDRQLPDQSIDSGGVLNDSYDYDPNGNVQAISDGLTGRGHRDMTYDGLNRLLSTTSPMFVGGTQYEYNALDDLTRVKAPGRDHTYVYDQHNHLTNITNPAGDTVAGLGYDDTRGNLTNKDGQLFEFDYGNRLRNVVGKESYIYDGQGRRVQAAHDTLGSIYSMYGLDGALRFQKNERQGKTTDYIMLSGSLIARVSNNVSPAVPVADAPSFVTIGNYSVTWTAVDGASRYEVQERKNSGSWAPIYSGTALSKAISGKTSGVYGYQVRACNQACSAWSGEVSVSVLLPPTGVPKITLPLTALNGDYTVSWTASTGATEYRLEEKNGSGDSWELVYQGSARSKGYTGKSAGDHSYRVRGCNDADCTAYSDVKTVESILKPTGKPTLTVPADSKTGSYTASWTTVATATNYRLAEQVGSGAWNEFVANSGTSQIISGRATGTYHYQVRACNDAGCGPYSTIRDTVVLTPPTSAPTLTVPATNASGSYTVSWTAVATTTRYEIQESTNGAAWTPFYSGTARSKAASGKTTASYGYRGRACNGSGCGSYSATKTVSVLAKPVTPSFNDSVKRIWYKRGPSGSTLIQIQCTVSWTAVAGAATYELKAGTADGPGDVQYVGSETTIQGSYNTAMYCASTQVLRACNSTGCSSWSPTHTQRVIYMNDPPPPGDPGNPQVIEGGEQEASPADQDQQGEGE